jgi:phosphopantetheinyl transferase (holo-ACP synthase)
MSQIEELRQIVASLLRAAPAEIGPETSLAALNTSLGGARVRLGLKRVGLTLPTGSNPTTFGALLSAISGDESSASGTAIPIIAPMLSPSAPAPQVAVGANGLAGLCVGLDVEDIRSLPEASDYWEHEFYRGSFARSEISYAVLQIDPRMHFAGFWCAKEALRKCDPSFASVSPALTAVAHDSNGRPYLTMDAEVGLVRLPHALSISHAAELATAIVIAIPAQSLTPAHPEAAVDSDPVSAESAAAIVAVSLPTEPVATDTRKGFLGRLFGRG